LCHPHPLHGGSMRTKALYRAAEALTDLGLRTLRFNFRGVGCSTGAFEEGIGEKDDVRAALDWLNLGVRDGPLIAGGMSFGSMVALTVGSEDPRVSAMVGIGTPIRIYDYGYLARAGKPILIVQGEQDEFGPAREVAEVVGSLGDHVTVREIAGSGHLFEGHFDDLKETIRAYFSTGPGAEVLTSDKGDPRKKVARGRGRAIP
jgi:alpha/beta superfamily hydrolase